MLQPYQRILPAPSSVTRSLRLRVTWRKPSTIRGEPHTHLFNSALFGAVFVLLFAKLLTFDKRMLAKMLGLLYGVAWWVVGALWIMPAWLGMGATVFEVGDNQWWSLAGHLIYGLLLVPPYIMARPMLSRRS